jgi:hypothetical protein
MPTSWRRWKKAALVVTAAVALAWCVAAGDGASAQPAPRGELKRFYWTSWLEDPIRAGCAATSCHGQEKEQTRYVCRMTEYRTWKNEDKHSDAYKVLLEPRSQKMGERLGWGKDVSKRAECVACHGIVIRQGDRVDVVHKGFKNTSLVQEGFDPEKEGVTCSVCHGPYRNWRAPHALPDEPEKWRNKKRSEKEKELGMTDLWDPIRRTTLCASCHIGNHAEGKVVTHEMYAVGHPPLPSFEVGAFSEQMPHHWQYLRDKSAEAKKLLDYDGKEQEQAKLVVVGAAVSLRESMRLLAGQAGDCEKALADPRSDPDRRALDLASFDCYACHHDLTSRSWRQERPATGRPGRPPMPSWPTALVDLALEALGTDEDSMKLRARYPGLLRDVQSAFTASPYGDPVRVRKAAQALADWADTLATQLNERKKSWDAEGARKILAQLPKLYKDRTLDYDSARQVAWAFQGMVEERREADATVKKVLKSLDGKLGLAFPQGKKRIEATLDARMKILYDYDPDRFRADLRTLFNRRTTK